MILRRLAEAIQAQNWFTVVLEILVVVVGILIGLQVDEWNQVRQDKKTERNFVAQLHNDIERAEQLSERVRERRLENLQFGINAGDVLFKRIDRDILTDGECRAISAIGAFNVVVADLPSLNELIATGRLHVLQDNQLRSALLGFEETKNSLNRLILLQTIASPDLVRNYSNLIQTDSFFEPTDNEIRGSHICDVTGMRKSRAFLNDFSISIDMYDAYVRDGLAPWDDQLNRVHKLVDSTLGQDHAGTESP